MVIVSLPNPLAHNSSSLDARALHENVFIKLWFLLPALIQDTVLVSQGYRSGCYLLQALSVDGWFDLALQYLRLLGGEEVTLVTRDPEVLLPPVKSLFNVWRLQEHPWAALQFPVCALSVNVGDPF